MSAIKQPGVQIIIFSRTAATVAIISDTDESGNLLELEISVLKNGGLNKFTFSLAKNTDVPITLNAICYFYINGVLWDTGYVTSLPEQDQNEPAFKVSGNGWFHRLKEKFISVTYTTTAFTTMVASFLSTYLTTDLGITYDAGKISLPTGVTAFTMVFYNRNMLDCVMDFINIANYDYATAQYRFWIDAELEFNIGLIPTTITAIMFEGYHYQSPSVELDRSKLVNKVLVYKTETVTPNDLTYVGTYQDTVSQGKYGILEKKFILPTPITTAALEEMTDALLSKYSEPIERIEVKDLEVTAPVDFKTHALSNKRDMYREEVGEYNSLANWDLSAQGVTGVVISTTHVLTKRQCIRLVTTSGSLGTYIEYILPKVIPFPKEVRIFYNFALTAIDVTVGFIDEDDVEFEVSLAQILGWTKAIGRLDQQIDDDLLLVNYDTITEAELIVNETFFGGIVLYGDCESAINPPQIDGNSQTAEAIVARSIEQVYAGSYSYKYIKGALSGTSSLFRFTAGASTTLMRGFIAGVTYRLTIQVYIPSGLLTANQFSPYIGYYNAGAWTTVAAVPAYLYDQWQTVTTEVTLPPTTTGAAAGITYTNSVVPEAFAYFDHVAIDIINLIKYADCEDATYPPQLDGNSASNVSASRSAVVAYEGTYSYKLNKNVAGGASAYYRLTANGATDDLHGLVPGVTYRIDIQVYIPSGGMLYNEVWLYLYDYEGSWGSTYVSAVATYNAWQKLTVTRTIRADATGTQIWLYFGSPALLNEHFYIDEVVITPVHGDTMTVGRLITEGISTIKAVRINLNSNTGATLYIDRIEVESDSYKYHEAIPEEIKYKLSAQALLADIAFGSIEDSLIDSIKEKAEPGDLALAIYART